MRFVITRATAISLAFDYRIVEGGKANPYVASLVKRGIWYNPARMVLRGCKVHDKGVEDPSLRKFNPVQGDETDQMWEADADESSRHVVTYVKKVSNN